MTVVAVAVAVKVAVKVVMVMVRQGGQSGGLEVVGVDDVLKGLEVVLL